MSSKLNTTIDNVPQLRVPRAISKFPLSSPISDDQISSRSFESRGTANSSTLASSPQSSPNPFDDTESGNTSGQDEFHLERYSESSSWTETCPANHHLEKTSRDSSQGRDTSLERKKKPGLNIVTDFSRTNKHVPIEDPLRNCVPVQQPRHGKENSRPTTEASTSVRKVVLRNPGFVNLSDLEGLRKNKKSMFKLRTMKDANKGILNPFATNQIVQAKEDDSAGHIGVHYGPPVREVSRNMAFKSSQSDQDNVPYHLQAPVQRTNDVSPTARSVVIGISVPENEVDAHKPGDELSSALTLQTPNTPTIIVTPADVTVGWSGSHIPHPLVNRPASSTYSQAIGTVYRQDADAPPVPSLPDLHRRFPAFQAERSRSSDDTWEAGSAYLEPPLSSATIIDEGDAHQTITRPLSTTSKDEVLPLSSSTARPRSKGWWNLMLSPMLSRAGTNATKKHPSPVEEPPSIPCLSMTTEKGLGLAEEVPANAMSPQTPRRTGMHNNRRNSTWSNWTQWEQAREQAQASQQSSECADDTREDTTPGHESGRCGQTVMDAPTKKSGLAAEYYQGCAFDLLNPVPYFECANHDCANALPKLVDFHKSEMAIEDSKSTVGSEAGPLNVKSVTGSPWLHREAHLRSESGSTVIEDDSVELSPNVRTADVRPIGKAVAPTQNVAALTNNDPEKDDKPQTPPATAAEVRQSASGSATPAPPSPPLAKPNIPRYVRIMPPSHHFAPSSPGPLSPEAQRVMHPGGGFPMSEIHQPAPTVVQVDRKYPADLPPRPAAACISLSDIEDPVKVRQKAEGRRHRLEQEDAVAHKAGGLWRGRGCFSNHGCFGRGGSVGRARRRWYIGIAAGLIFIIILSVVLATQLTRRGDQTPVQSQWLNLTGYPPMPTGISTIAQPDIASAVTACVQPSSLWSCALPRENQASGQPNKSPQPDFRLEIRFRNGTVNTTGTVPILSGTNKSATLSRRMTVLKRQDDPFTDSLFEPKPSPPSLAEQTFIGNTTDNITFPYGGDPTPFFITMLTTDPSVPDTFNDTNQHSGPRRRRRQINSDSGSIPAPAVLSDGTAAPANLLPQDPLPFSQPVMLYNRGQDTEHYGFYTYFDRSIFVKATSQFNSSSSSTSNGEDGDVENSNGGVLKQDADLRCTWAQTRFLVQVWTSPRFAGQLVASANGTQPSSGPANERNGGESRSGPSSATDFSRPGSFPYPVTVKLDRHGGASSKKGVYCYGMDGQQKIVVSEKKLVAEIRGAGGRLINAAPGIFSDIVGDDGFDAQAGGIDGGTGGCGCEWRNWAGNGGQ